MGDSSIYYRTPQALMGSTVAPKRVLLIGQCFLDTWPAFVAELGELVILDRVIFNHVADLPASPPQPVEDYDFQVISLPLRPILPEFSYMSTDSSDPDAYAALFADAVDRMRLLLKQTLVWNTSFGLTSMVCNFLVPQQNPLGRTLPRYELRNIVHFVERLNVALSEAIAEYKHVYMVDADQVSASLGRRYVQDDAVNAFSHGSLLDNYGTSLDSRRLQPPQQTITEYYGLRTAQFVQELWLECCAIFRTLQNLETVKLVIIDLDDTLWRGVQAEEAEILPQEAIEGWPLGFADALHFLHARGVILAIASKNEPANVERIFAHLLPLRLPLSRFAIKKINWLPKADNVKAIIEEANVGASSVVFIDDNVVERESVAQAIPGIRTLGADPYGIRRELLWSAETQVAAITAESSRRNEMIAAQVARETTRPSLSREDFLRSLQLKINFFFIEHADDPRTTRVFELINKTNQFNTTGERWDRKDLDAEIDTGTIRVLCWEVADKYTAYGLVGVLLIEGNTIRQAVMSCRVFGLNVETAVMRLATHTVLSSGYHEVLGRLVHTDKNMPCQNWFATNGFSVQDSTWRLGNDAIALEDPAFIEVNAPVNARQMCRETAVEADALA